ncbi:histidine--tRNA ligase [Flavobacterium urocaniciphilum]|uniref:Histidine--tRNA ligase n=1 Tax=Flavobacterium urocaniciphilum TaxID=1299341 RepID=A0A1H8YS98_9FLAO|nr:histidine--tRNA ligase [Flavobacterium urocaniciphilum]SEP55017.1 histidyl-tRNA synthetase [Flavobacterium urocaniciphilum]
MAQKPSIPKGTRDFSSTEVAKRNYIFSIIKSNFEQFGFQPIETPTFENSETLMGKYGEEGDRLIFKILNSGNYFFNKNKIEIPGSIAELQSKSADDISKEEIIQLNQFTSKISEKALRYDLTVPFARYVVQHQNELEFPFKRYQIQPVWRADRPQKGRFREFYQCDADVVGSNSLWQEVEFVQLYDTVFTKLGLQGVTIKINNRKVLSGIAEVIGASDKLIDFTVALDKLDKIGEEGVKKEMLEKGISDAAIEKVQPLFNFTGTINEKIEKLASLLATSEEGTKGVEELKFICNAINELGLQSANLDLDVTLARGLNYYTGAIYEVAAPEGVAMGSIGGGGRYDDLTGIFGLKNMSGVGISFGLDRIYLVMEELNLFPETVTSTSKAMFINFGEVEALFCLKTISQLRQNGIKVEMYPDAAKMGKQFQFAEKKGIPFTVIVGEEEMKQNQFKLKDLASGEQVTVSLEELIEKLK